MKKTSKYALLKVASVRMGPSIVDGRFMQDLRNRESVFVATDQESGSAGRYHYKVPSICPKGTGFGAAVTSTISSANPVLLWSCASVFAIIAVQQAALAQDATPIPDVSVNASATPLMDGSAAAGYRVKDTSASGPIWGDLPIQDAPYSITVVPSALIENTNTYRPEDVFRLIPQITNVTDNGSGIVNAPLVRGFAVGFSVDGLTGPTTGFYGSTKISLEDKEAVQLLGGVNGFLYGNSTNLGGDVDFTLKRPTAAPYYALTFGDNAGANGYIHGDFGGPLAIPGLDPSIFGYRLNLVGQDGQTSIDNQTVKRDLLSGAFDIHLPWDILVQLNASHNYEQTDGLKRTYTLSGFNPFPAPPDPSTNYAPNWTRVQDTSDTGGVKVTWKPNDIFTLRSQYQFTRSQYLYPAYVSAQALDYNGTMNVSSNGGSADTYFIHSGYAFLDADFSTFGVKHKVTTGFSGNSTAYDKNTCAIGTNSATFVTNLYNPTSGQFQNPGQTIKCGQSLGYITSQSYVKNYFIGDRMLAFDDRLIVLAGANYTSNGSNSFNNTGTTTGYVDAQITPTVSLTYKLLPWLSAYGSYQQGLQNAQLVTNSSTVIYTNAGATLPPYLAEQYEGGFKATVGTNLLLTLDYFHIREEHIYSIPNSDGTYTLSESGNETHQGLEFAATGKLTDELTLFGGFTLEDPRIVNAVTTPWQNGQMPAGVSPVSAKLYAEYTLPFMASLPDWVHGLTLTGGIFYTGPANGSTPSSYATIGSIFKFSGYTTGELGFRYDTKLYEHPFTLRFNVTNITNHAYWEVFASGVVGTEGPPRTFLATATVKW